MELDENKVDIVFIANMSDQSATAHDSQVRDEMVDRANEVDFTEISGASPRELVNLIRRRKSRYINEHEGKKSR